MTVEHNSTNNGSVETTPLMEPWGEHGRGHRLLGSKQQQQQTHPPLSWKDEWRDFLIALRSPTQSFNPWRWIYRLSQAGLYSLCRVSRLSRLMQLLHLDNIGWRSLVPIFAIWLVLAIVVGGYFGSVRSFLRERWCQSTDSHCSWMYIHDITVAYFGVMILWNYIYTMFASPGVLIPPFVPGNVVNVVSVATDQTYTWKASKSQGGFAGCNPSLNVNLERKRLTRDYGDLGRLETSSCPVCQIPNRPPRCHHCHTCQRCVLRYDHHCMWLNNCIGYYNYRTFLLTLFYLSMSCFYGACLLLRPFYEPLAEQVRQHGLGWLYSNHTGFLDLPSPVQLIQELIRKGTLDPTIVIKLVYPILLGLCVILGSFLAFHLIYVVNGCTTLEYKIFLEQQHFGGIAVKNPFDQGWKANLAHVFGGPRGMLYAFLPVPVALPPPFVPQSDEQKIR